MEYAPVFPVPFLARARISLPLRATGMEASWIGDGLSHPFSKIPINKSRFKQKSSNSLPLVSVTSDVRFLLSLGGSTSWDFQDLSSTGLELKNEQMNMQAATCKIICALATKAVNPDKDDWCCTCVLAKEAVNPYKDIRHYICVLSEVTLNPLKMSGVT